MELDSSLWNRNIPKQDSQPESNSVNWESLNSERKVIKGYLKSLNCKAIGTGLVYFYQPDFKLYPRSSITSNHMLQWIATIGTEGATFEAVQGSLISLLQKIEALASKIKPFNPQSINECTKQSQEFFLKWVELDSLARTAAKDGLEQLSENYLLQGKKANTRSLISFGDDILPKIKELKENLFRALLPIEKDLEPYMKLDAFGLSAKKLLKNQVSYCKDAREVGWDPHNGASVNLSMLEDSVHNVQRKMRYNAQTVKNAACIIKLPTQAKPIPAQNGAIKWIPVRPAIENNKIIFQEASVVGTCERGVDSTEHLCNLYYKIDPTSNKITLSTGAIDSPLKGQEIAELILKLTNEYKQKNNRWVLHQLNSYFNPFFDEKGLIQKVHTQALAIDTRLKEEARSFCFMHINTAFNAATQLDNEDPQSLKEINIDTLAQLAMYVKEDVSILLAQTLFNVESEAWKNFHNSCGEVFALCYDIRRLKGGLASDSEGKNNSGKVELEENQDLEIPSENGELREGLQSVLVSDTSMESNPKLIITTEPELSQKVTDLTAVKFSGKIKTLEGNQSELEKKLKVLCKAVNVLIVSTEAYREIVQHECYYPATKSVLILKTFEMILRLQLKEVGTPQISRVTEIEFFLLLYRLLDIKMIVSCWSGLDRTGAIIAVDDSLSQLEYLLTDLYNKQSFDPDSAAIQEVVYQTLYDLIIGLDSRKETIFQLTNQILTANPNLYLIKDANFIGSPEKLAPIPNFNLREQIIEKIKDSCCDSERQMNAKKADALINTLVYLEMFAAHLLGPQQEKTFYSTGVFGLKYHHDRSYVRRTVTANDHPIERLPQFIFLKDKTPVQLIIYTGAGYVMNSSTALTKICKNLFLRLSKLRGT